MRLYIRFFLALATHQLKKLFLAFFHRGGGAPLRQFAPLGDFCRPEIWSESNRKISITIDFALPEKIPGRKPGFARKVCFKYSLLFPVSGVCCEEFNMNIMMKTLRPCLTVHETRR